MLKKDNPLTQYRVKILKTCLDRNYSMETIATITDPMNGLPDYKKEEIAKQLLDILLNCKTEREILQKVKQTEL